jgi:hypothetical protein
LRPDLWRIYARSGERKIREFATQTNLRFGDNKHSHWDVPGKDKGLFLAGNGDEGLPLYWRGRAWVERASTSDLNDFIWLYQLTGCRRAREFVEEYAEGYKKNRGAGARPIMTLRHLAQAYGLTWDPALRELAIFLTDRRIVDPQGVLGLNEKQQTEVQSLGPLYKTNVDIAGFLDAWRIFGDQRYYDLTLRLARYWWFNYLGEGPLFYVNYQGLMGQLLFEASGGRDMSYPDILALQMRRLRGTFNHRACDVTFVFQGIPYAEDLLVRTGTDKTPAASWVAYRDMGTPTSIFARKTDKQALDIQLRTVGDAKGWPVKTKPLLGGADEVCVRPVTAAGAGKKLEGVVLTNDLEAGCAEILIPREAPEGVYEIVIPPPDGFAMAVAQSKAPLVLYAPDYWRMPSYAPNETEGGKQNLPIRWYFNVPTNSQNAQILFQKSGYVLYAPDGKPWSPAAPQEAGKNLPGWVTLPADKPGLWSFVVPEMSDMFVRARNFLPFFAADDPRNYFEPPIAWPHEKPYQPPEKPAPGTVYVPGAIQTPGNRALYLSGNRSFKLESGLPPASAAAEKESSQLLPFKQGTVDFFYKPFWTSFESFNVSVLEMSDVTGKLSWPFYFYRTKDDILGWFRGDFTMDGPGGRKQLRMCRDTLISSDDWIHVAWVWGPDNTKSGDGAANRGRKVLAVRIFVNGQLGHQSGNDLDVGADQFLTGLPKTLAIGPGAEAAYDELRVSDIQRYTEDFTPPARDKEISVDEHTRALFHFNGNAEGQSYGQPVKSITGEIK